MVESAVELLRERSSAGVTIDAVLARSGAPRGSVYHHFPGGRDQLVREAVEHAGHYVARIVDGSDGSPTDVVTRLVTFWERVLVDTGYTAGCPVVSLTVDAGETERSVVQEIFALWHTRLVEVFTRDGLAAERADRLATLVIAASEGAVLLCRAQRSAEPLHAVGDELRLLVQAVQRGVEP
jgi:AcrR family transcriptional regulator